MRRVSWRPVVAAATVLAVAAPAWADLAPSPVDVASSGLGWAIAGIVALAALGIWFYRRKR